LNTVMEGFAISKGDRGEFLVLLLLILARDGAVGRPDPLGRPITGKRWVDLSDFLYGHLFRKQAQPSLYVEKETISALEALKVDFPSARVYFNHFIKVHEYKAIDLTSLLLLQGRGAGVLCANNQTGIDAINVFLHEGTKLSGDNAGLILEQIKNDSKFKQTPQRRLFDAMNPYYLGILEDGHPAVPLIKIVFALASKTPSLNVVRYDPSEDYNATVYEIWCAGISPDILHPIEHQYIGLWAALLQASYGWQELYKGISSVTKDLRRSAVPGAALDSGHYACWARRT